VTLLEPSTALTFALALRLAVATATLVLWRRHRLARQVAFIGSAVASVITGSVALAVLHTSVPIDGTLFVHRASAIALSYSIDGLGSWFLLVLSMLALPIAVFSIGYVAHPPLDRRSAFIGIGFNVLIGAV
jgi:formate hydrogenlyase subunit 3/multisubunit Na+/H+ antiporter MnhD subunit